MGCISQKKKHFVLFKIRHSYIELLFFNNSKKAIKYVLRNNTRRMKNSIQIRKNVLIIVLKVTFGSC